MWDQKVLKKWATGQTQTFIGVKNIPIAYRTFMNSAQKGAVVISSGRTECMLKYQEVIFDLVELGYSVYILDHRGQGFSGRMAKDPQIGHVDEFNDYVEDLKTFVETIAMPSQQELSLPHNTIFLLAHSMGGCIASLYLEKYPTPFAAAVLCSPMHKPSTGFIPTDLCKSVAQSTITFATGADYALGKGPYQDIPFSRVSPTDYKNITLTHSEVRYEAVRSLYNAHPEVKLGGPSYNWVYEAINAGQEAQQLASKIAIPILLLQAGEDTIVDADGHHCFARRAEAFCRLEKIEGAYHELLVESDEYRNQAMRMSLLFFDEYL